MQLQQDFLFLHFGIQALISDHGLARLLEHRFFRLENFAEPLQEQDRLAAGGERGGFERKFSPVRRLLHPWARADALVSALAPNIRGHR